MQKAVSGGGGAANHIIHRIVGHIGVVARIRWRSSGGRKRCTKKYWIVSCGCGKVGARNDIIDYHIAIAWITVVVDEINRINWQKPLNGILRNGRLVTTAEINTVPKSGGRVHSVQQIVLNEAIAHTNQVNAVVTTAVDSIRNHLQT